MSIKAKGGEVATKESCQSRTICKINGLVFKCLTFTLLGAVSVPFVGLLLLESVAVAAVYEADASEPFSELQNVKPLIDSSFNFQSSALFSFQEEDLKKCESRSRSKLILRPSGSKAFSQEQDRSFRGLKGKIESCD